MNKQKSLKKLGIPGLALSLVGLSFLSTANAAQAAYLYWGSTAVKTASTNTCFSFAYDTLRSLNFQNIRRSQGEVAGSRGRTYAAITCIGTGPRATAMVMVVGDDGGETVRVRDELRSKIAGIILFD
jgi:hypothetical protein